MTDLAERPLAASLHPAIPEDRADAPPVQLLAQDGTYTPNPDFPVDLDHDGLRGLYALMAKARGVNEQATILQRQGQLGIHLSCRGQEAAQVGSASALGPEDWVFPQGRELAAALTRGLRAEDICHVWRGTWFTNHDPRATRFAPYTMPIATQCLHAAGLAMGAKAAGDPIVALAYCGDGGTSEGDFHEAVNFAAVYEAPAVFFIQNNQWAISVPLGEQCRAPSLAHKAVGYGIPGVRCDGQDVLAAYAVTRWAAERARSGKGPALIEAMTYRLDGHSTSDDPTRYQPAEEIAAWEARDPIERFRRFLQREGLWDEEFGAAVEADTRHARDQLRDAIVDAPHLPPSELFAHVYVTPTPDLVEQQARLEAELARD